jgi:hypothetical protein
MRRIAITALLAGFLSFSAEAQSEFRAVLSPTFPTSYPVPASATFSLDGTTVNVGIRFLYDGASFSQTAHLLATDKDFSFDVGHRFTAIHSHDLYGMDPGVTGSWGSFELPAFMREDFVSGRATLRVTTPGGNYEGLVTHTPEPSTAFVLIGLAAMFARRRPGK